MSYKNYSNPNDNFNKFLGSLFKLERISYSPKSSILFHLLLIKKWLSTKIFFLSTPNLI